MVAASDRAARALRLALNRRKRAEGLTAWPTPNIQDWNSFLQTAWEEYAADGRMLLNSAQEQALWADLVGKEEYLTALLPGPRHRLARMAMQAHELLCAYAPEYLRASMRSGWIQNAGAFSRWLTAFDEQCRALNLLSPGRVPMELIPLLESNAVPRPPILTAGFDRMQPLQRSLFRAWGAWQQTAPGDAAREVRFFAAKDSQSELEACALWCKQRLIANPEARLLVVTQRIDERRGEMERAFLRCAAPGDAPLFEFSLGIPLGQAELPHALYLLLRWLNGALTENELDWLISTGLAGLESTETAALQAYMRALRRKGLQRTEWTLDAFARQRPAAEMLPSAWTARFRKAQQRLVAVHKSQLSPLDWAARIPQLLQDLGLPSEHRLSSAEYQSFRRWEQAVETCGSLGFDNRRADWTDFLASLARTLNETLFAPESSNAPILIAGPAESAGLTADAIWFLGADEDLWPAAGSTHPLLPLHVQRECAMPHATPLLDLELARTITTRLLSAAPVVHFSFAALKRETETRPSKVVTQLAGTFQPLPAALMPPPAPPPRAVLFEDASRIPFPPHLAHGGSSVLTAQSQCPFKAFATTRLDARRWEPAEAGLTAAERGKLLHEVLHEVWEGPSKGIRTYEALLKKSNLPSFVEGVVHQVMQEKMPEGARERMPSRYLAIEEIRLARLVTEWLEYEVTRLPFTVESTEITTLVNVAGLALRLRLDRIDRLNDGSPLVIDYKTGDVSPKAWELPRADDVQLPLYASFALQPGEQPGGLVFAKVRTGEQGFSGYVVDANRTLFPALKGSHTLMKNALTTEQMHAWKESIEQLARDFLAGRADVDPRQFPATCERCGLQTLCRIQEHQACGEDEEEIDEASDE